MKALKHNYQEKRVKKERKFGDHSILIGCISSPVWKVLLTNFNKAIFLIIKDWFRFVRGMINYCFCNVFRTSSGVNQSGFLISISSCLYLLSYNSTHIPFWLTGCGIFYIPSVCFFKSSDEMIAMLMVGVHSEILNYYSLLLIVTSLISLFKIILGKADSDGLSSRGISRIYLGLKWIFRKLKIKKIKISRPFIEGVLEPILLFIAAFILYDIDWYASIFILLMGLSELSINLYNKAVTLKQHTLIQA